MFYIKERATLGVANPVVQELSPEITESLISDLKIKEVRAVYPLVKAINSGRLTKNFTFYPAESLIGKNKIESPTGYASFVKPYGKPVIREHNAQATMGLLGPTGEADVPMGRIVYAGYRKRNPKTEGMPTSPSKPYIPGSVEGDGSLYMVPAITDPEAITRVLGGAYQTVSIGSRVDNVWEAISTQNIAELRRKGEDLPPYERGQLYEGKLSYWKMGEIKGIELSFVNVPSDEYAGVVDPDIGAEGIRLLVAEKKTGRASEYNFFDAKTSEKVDLDEMDEFVYDESFFVDSAKVGQDIWWLNTETADITESVNEQDTYHCSTHPEETSSSADSCSICGKTMTKVDDDDEEDEKTDQPQLQESEDTDMAKGFNLDEATVTEIIAEYKKESKLGEAFKELLLATFKTDENVTSLVEGNGENIADADLFSQISEFATEIYGEWNENAANFALSLYLNKGGTLKEPLVESKEEISESSCIVITEEEVRILPLYVVAGEKLIPLVVLNTPETLSEFTNSLNDYNKLYNIWESDEDQMRFVEKLKSLESIFETKDNKVEFSPILISAEKYINSQLVQEQSTRNELATLAGLIRKNKVSKEDLNAAQEAYCVFGNSILKQFIEAGPIEEDKSQKDSTDEESVEETPSETPAIETIVDPISPVDVPVTKAVKKSKDLWLGVRVVPKKRTGKHSVN